MFELPGKTALVTGAATRLGRSTALILAKAGCDIIIHYNTSRSMAEETADAVREIGSRAWTISLDLSEPENAGNLIERSLEYAGTIDILVNSASIFPAANIHELAEETLIESFRVNTLSPNMLCRRFYEAAKHDDRDDGSRCIINYLDARIVDYDVKHVPYHLSKRALFSLTRMMSIEYAPLVRVNAVAPGLILPPPGVEDETFLERYRHTNPLNTHGTPEQVAAATLFLAWNEFTTGQVIYVDGGRHLKGSMYGV